MSVVAVAWLAIEIAPPGQSGMLLGAALAAYALPGAAGALLFGRWLRRLPAGRLLVADSRIRAVLLGCIPLAWVTGVLHPVLYVTLLAGSSVLHAWGNAGKYSLLAGILPPTSGWPPTRWSVPASRRPSSSDPPSPGSWRR